MQIIVAETRFFLFMYNISDYGDMIADKVRMDAYAYALKDAVKPDSIVLDIGAATGIHALLACKFGARQVYAIEPNDAIHLARELAIENGFADRITFHHDISTNITLPEKADVIVSDLRGQLPLFGQHIASIVDARERHLAPDGVLIPQRDNISVALVQARNIYNDLTAPWQSPYGLKMEAAKRHALNVWDGDDTELFKTRHLLMKPSLWTTLDYATIENPNITPPPIVQTAVSDGTAHGLLIWFDAEISDEISFSNAPDADKIASVYGRAFFPLLQPVPIAKGDTIRLTIEAELVDDEYEWRWQTHISGADGVKADFEQGLAA